jgi:hypothetical protein
MLAKEINAIFRESILDYHTTDDVDAEMPKKYQDSPFGKLLYLKNWIDTVQWHLEDIIRDPKNEPSFLVAIKRVRGMHLISPRWKKVVRKTAVSTVPTVNSSEHRS